MIPAGLPTETDGAVRSQRNARIVLAVALVLLGGWTLRTFLPALGWAAIFAIALWPLYNRTKARFGTGGHGIVLPLAFTLGIAVIFLAPLGLIGLQIGRELNTVVHWIGQVRTEGMPAPDWIARLPLFGEQAREWWQANLSDAQASHDFLGRFGRDDILPIGRAMGQQIAHRAVLFGFTLLALFFLFRDGDRLVSQMLVASRRAFGPRGERVGRQIVASVHGTVDGLVLVGVGEGVVLGIGYYLAGVPHPALLGALTALLAMIPFGAPLVFGAASLVLLAQDSTVAAIVIFAMGLVVTFVADHFIRPVLIGGATRLPFLWVLLGILGGIETWGLLGLFLGPAIMAALILLWREWTDTAPL